MKFMLYGSEDSRFLKGVRGRAAKHGIDCVLTDKIKPCEFYICDWETFPEHKELPYGFNLDYPVPAVAVATVNLASGQYKDLTGKTVLIIGRGNATQGMPQLFLNKNATPIIAHSKTDNLLALILIADIVVNAAPPVDLEDYRTILKNKLLIDLVGKTPAKLFEHIIDAGTVGKETTRLIVNKMVNMNGAEN